MFSHTFSPVFGVFCYYYSQINWAILCIGVIFNQVINSLILCCTQ
nr:MAG TPA: hypothetical protein [Caudoviricetes sp.]DAT47211.1 MAG TPA: hypothetical protein [Crassvirales sp.]